MEVHRQLGNGFQEVIYQRALEIEMAANNIHFSREYEMPKFYKAQQIGTRRIDFLVDGVISVELKAHAAQGPREPPASVYSYPQTMPHIPS